MVVNQAHVLLTKSFYKAYPLAVRTQPLSSDISPYSTITSRILATTYTVNDSNNNNNKMQDNNNNTNNTPQSHNHLQEYLNNVKSGISLKDGTIDLELTTIVAVQPDRANGLPWFGKVICFIGTSKLELLWLHKTTTNNTKFYYLDSSTDIIHKDSVICNRVEFEPVYGYDQLLWKLLTPLSFIQALNTNVDDMPVIAAPFAKLQVTKKNQWLILQA